MKSLILGILIILTLSIGYLIFSNSENNNQVSDKSSVEIYECKYNQCHAIAKSTGNRCKHCVSNKGDNFCWQHD